MLKIALTTLPLLFAQFSMAAGAQKFENLKALQGSNFYRLTCSSVDAEAQVHVNTVIQAGTVKEMQVIVVFPSESLNVISFSKKDAAKLTANLGSKMLTVDGSRPGSYYAEDVSLEIVDGPQGLSGRFEYDNGDGMALDRQVRCGASNYILNPRN